MPTLMKEYASGRVMFLRWDDVLDGAGRTPQQIAETAQGCGARYLVVDTTHAPYADSGGVRWLLKLKSELEARGRCLRIAAKPNGRVWKILTLLQTGLEVYESVWRAWHTPWTDSKERRVRPLRLKTRQLSKAAKAVKS